MSQFETPILYLIFNRPDLVKQTFSKIKELKPKHLFLAADGPRKKNLEDIPKCKECKEWVLAEIDWDCELKTLFREENMGCGLAVSEAITWFFEHVEMGIILEDDCLPDLSFFYFCEKLLLHYKDKNRVMHIGGNNFQDNQIRGNASYYYSNYPHIWGWATWRRAWKLFDYKIFENNHLSKEFLFNVFKADGPTSFWLRIQESLKKEHKSIWDYQWSLSIYSNMGIAINPNYNLVKNIGFGEHATHTLNGISIEVASIEIPLRHPERIQICHKADKHTFRKFLAPKTSIKNHLRNLGYSYMPTTLYLILKKTAYRILNKQLPL